MTLREAHAQSCREVIARARGWARATVPQRRRRASLELMAAVGRLERLEAQLAVARVEDEADTEPRMKTIPDHDP